MRDFIKPCKGFFYNVTDFLQWKTTEAVSPSLGFIAGFYSTNSRISVKFSSIFHFGVYVIQILLCKGTW